MASPPPTSHQTRSNSSEDYYYYLVLAVVAVTALLLVSNMIAIGCCSPCSIVEAIRRFLRYWGLSAGESNDERVPEVIPVRKYQREQAQEHECAVCLSVIADGEDVRQLPRCKHSFHAPCIDMWLYSHSTCPLCRADVLERASHRYQTAAAAAAGEISIQRHPIEPRAMGTLILALV